MSVRALRFILRARAVITFVLRAASTLETVILFLSKKRTNHDSQNFEQSRIRACDRAIAKILRARDSEQPVQFLRENRAKATFCEHVKIVRDHLIPLGVTSRGWPDVRRGGLNNLYHNKLRLQQYCTKMSFYFIFI